MVDFKYEKINKITIYRIIGHTEGESGCERAPGGGQMVKVMTTKEQSVFECHIRQRWNV